MNNEQQKLSIRLFIKWGSSSQTSPYSCYHRLESLDTFDILIKTINNMHETNSTGIIDYCVVEQGDRRFFYSTNNRPDFNSKDWLVELLRYPPPEKCIDLRVLLFTIATWALEEKKILREILDEQRNEQN